MANVQFDYTSVRNRLIKSLQSKTSWADILDYATNTRLIDAVAENIAELAEYDEYLTRETKWSLAQNRSSLVNQVDILSYTPHRKISATGTLRVSSSENVASVSVRKWDETAGYSTGDFVVYYNDNNYRYYEAQTTILPADDDNPNTAPDETNEWERVDETYAVNIEIPKYSTFSDGGDLRVTTVDAFVLNTDDDYVRIDAIEGVAKTETRTATGVNYEEFEINNDSIDNTNYELSVDGITWTNVDDLRLSDSTDTSYEINNNADGSGIILRFGNDVFGQALEAGATIEFKFIETSGLSGNITSINTINETVSNFFDTNGSAVDLYVINDETIGGGKDVESLESIRTNGPMIFQTGGRATSADDYQAILEDFDFVSQAIAWGEYEYNIDNNNSPGTFIAAEENVVHIAAFTTAGEELNSSQQDEIRTDLNLIKSPTDIIQFEDVTFISLIFNVSSYVRNRSYTLTTVKNAIVSGLSTEYGINNRDFAENLYKSDYTAYIDDIDGVSYHNTTIQLYQIEEFESGYASSWNFAIYPIEEESIEVYIKLKDAIDSTDEWELVAIDNGLGGLSGQNEYTATGSSINYEFGTGTLIIEHSDTDKLDQFYSNYEIKILYESTNDNLELSKRSQVLNYAEANVTTNYVER